MLNSFLVMVGRFYKRAIAVALERLRVLVEKRQQIDRQIDRLKAVVTANSAMLSDTEREQALQALEKVTGTPAGFTDAIREVMRRNQHHSLSPTAVRDQLKAVNFDVSQYENPLAYIHTILKRLHQRGEIDRTPDGAYRWRGE